MHPTHLKSLITVVCLAALTAYPHAVAQAVAQAADRSDLIGSPSTYQVQKGDTLSRIARHFDIGPVELSGANPGIASTKLKPGLQLTIPSQHLLPMAAHDGVVINLAALRIFDYMANGEVLSFPVSIGREGWETPTGTTIIVQKRKNPTWTPPASIRKEDPSLPAVVPAGPNNPLGQFALSLDWDGYLIHGTNVPASVGKPASHGCIRLYPEDIAVLFDHVTVGTKVTIIDQPVVFGWQGDALYVQVSQPWGDAGGLPGNGIGGQSPASSLESVPADLQAEADIDEAKLSTALSEHTGLPVVIGQRRQVAPLH